MVQVTTVHDAELNQKVFRVRGDEGYAKGTSISIVDANEYTYHVTDYDMQITATLKRGTGNSYVAIVDNGVTLGLVEWQSTDTTKTIDVEGLTYDVEHNISVRYLGNTQCLKSTSNTIQVQEENSTAKVTQIILDVNNNYVNYDKGGTIKCKVMNTTDNVPVTSKPVKLYINNVYKQGATTNSSGEVTFNIGNISNLTNGLKQMKIIFDGFVSSDQTRYYTSSSVDFTYSLGLDISITSYREVFINGDSIGNYITGSVKDYYGDPVENKTVYLKNDTSLSYATEEDGSFTLRPSTIVNNEEYYISYGAIATGYSKSPNVTFKSATITSIEVSSNASMVTPNSSAMLSFKVNGTNIQGGIRVIVESPVYNTPLTQKTNDSGEFNLSYNGTGYGDVTFQAYCGSTESNTVTIEDLAFYYGNAIPNYAPYKVFSSSVQLMTDGIKMIIPNTPHCTFGLGNGNSVIDDFELTYDCNHTGNNCGLITNIATWSNSTGLQYTDDWNGTQTCQSNGDKFKITKINEEIKIYRKRTNESSYSLVGTTHYSSTHNNYPALDFYIHYDYRNSSNLNFKFNNIKLKKLNSGGA